MRLRGRRRVAVGDARLCRDPVHDLAIAVGVVDGHHVLQNRRAALEAEAGVDVLLRERRERAVGVQLVRHEDEVPELEEASAARARRRAVRLAAAVLLAPVPEDLRVRAAWSGPAHGPEVLGGRERDDPLRRHPDLLPELDRDLVGPELQLRVSSVDGDPDAIPVELHVVSDTNSRRELDRALLEVLPEREVAEHLEERQVVTVEARPRRCRLCGTPSARGSSAVPAEARGRGRTASAAACPHVIRSVESSPARGTSEYDGQRRWPRSSKNERKPSRSSAVVRIPGFYERCRRRPDAATPPEAGSPAPPGRRCEARRRARSRAGQPRPWRHGPPRPYRVAPGTRTRRATGRKRSR